MMNWLVFLKRDTDGQNWSSYPNHSTRDSWKESFKAFRKNVKRSLFEPLYGGNPWGFVFCPHRRQFIARLGETPGESSARWEMFMYWDLVALMLNLNVLSLRPTPARVPPF